MFLVVFFVVLCCGFVLTSEHVQTDRPNILIIIADDMGADAFGRFGIGTESPNTPNLDSLADTGLFFNNAWANPLCAPTRAAIMSGLYGSKTGVLQVPGTLDNSVTTILEAVESATGGEYADAVFGKWHLAPNSNNDHPNEQGADHFVGRVGGGIGDYFNWSRTEDGQSATSTEYVTTHITDAAIEWIGEQTTPWLAWVAHEAPHAPFHLPPDSLFTRSQSSTDLDLYLAMIESVDHEVGRLMGALTAEERENTLIIFVGDNGTPNTVLQAYPSRSGKGSLREGGLHVPMIVTGSGVARIGETEDSPVHVMDIYATILEIVGLQLDGGVNNSFSFNDLLSDEHAGVRPYNLSEITSGGIQGFAIRNEQYKLIEMQDGSQELYDLLLDPFEENDLLLSALSSEQSSTLSELSQEGVLQTTGWSCGDGILNGMEQQGSCSELGTTLEQHELPSGMSLGQNSPNPFSSLTQIPFSTGKSGETARLDIVDLSGRSIKTLLHESVQMGNHVATWDGSDEAGEQTASGVYLYRLSSGGRSTVKAMVRIR